MSRLRDIRKRLRSERGFTLTELLTVIAVSSIVLVAAVNLIDASVRASDEVLDRVDGLQKGRQAMEQVTQRLRSQVCPDKDTPAIAVGTSNSLSFYTELNSTIDVYGNPLFGPEARRITLSGGVLREEVWNSLLSPYASTFNTPANVNRVMAQAIEEQPGRPFFRYFAFVGNDPAKPELELPAPLSDADKARTVKVEVAYDSRPAKRGAQSNRFDTAYENEVFVRTADPTDPEHSPSCD